MRTLASDNFIRSPENPLSKGGNWSNPSDNAEAWYIATSGQAALDGQSQNVVAAYTGITWPNDQWSQCYISVFLRNGPAVRISGTGSSVKCYMAWPLGSTMYLSKLSGNSNSTIVTTSFTPGTNDLIWLGVQGTTLIIKQNNNTILTHTDASLASGAAGLEGYGTAVQPGEYVTNWSGGNFLANGAGLLLGVGAIFL